MKTKMKKYIADYIRDFAAVDIESSQYIGECDIELISAGLYVYDLFDPMNSDYHEFNYGTAQHVPVILDDDMNCEWFITVFFDNQMAALEIDLLEAACKFHVVEGFQLLEY